MDLRNEHLRDSDIMCRQFDRYVYSIVRRWLNAVAIVCACSTSRNPRPHVTQHFFTGKISRHSRVPVAVGAFQAVKHRAKDTQKKAAQQLFCRAWDQGMMRHLVRATPPVIWARVYDYSTWYATRTHERRDVPYCFGVRW